MSTKVETEQSAFRFTVKESGDGTPWIECEPYEPGLSAIGDGYLGLRLRDGIGITEAQEIASLLNKKIKSISHTRFL